MELVRGSAADLTRSVAISVLVLITSVAGLALPGTYAQETVNWTLQARGQDLGNLIAIVVLLLSAIRHRRGSWRARLVWLGSLLYLIYAFIVYAMALHLNALFLVYVSVLGLSAWSALFSVDRLRSQTGTFPTGSRRKLAAWTLIGTAVLFGLLWLSELIGAQLSGQLPASLAEAGLRVNPIHVIDLSVVLPGFLVAGVAALRGRDHGLFWTAPWLAFSVLMGASIVAAMLLIARAGFPGTLPPLLMVSLVVVANAVALWRYLGSG